jgi:hypothetical protein
MYSRLILVPWQLAACSACWLLARWLQISEIPDCPSWDGSIPAPATDTDTDGGLGLHVLSLNFSENQLALSYAAPFLFCR